MRYQNEIKKVITDIYGSEAALARQLNWPRQQLNKITTGTREPNLKELQQLSDKLKRPIGEMAILFLRL